MNDYLKKRVIIGAIFLILTAITIIIKLIKGDTIYIPDELYLFILAFIIFSIAYIIHIKRQK